MLLMEVSFGLILSIAICLHGSRFHFIMRFSAFGFALAASSVSVMCPKYVLHPDAICVSLSFCALSHCMVHTPLGNCGIIVSRRSLAPAVRVGGKPRQ